MISISHWGMFDCGPDYWVVSHPWRNNVWTYSYDESTGLLTESVAVLK